MLEDLEQFRKITGPILNQRLDWLVIGVVVDADDAVRLAKQLQPDVILLDIDLPRMNGVKAARRLRLVARDAKIVFLSQESSIGVVREALRLGARSFLRRECASRELILAVEAILQGRQFIGNGVADPNLIDIGEARADHSLKGIFANLAAVAQQSASHVPRHELQFWSEDTILIERAVSFVGPLLAAQHSAIICATESVRDRLHDSLTCLEPNMDDFILLGNYLVLDASDTLSAFMFAGSPSPAKFVEVLGGAITAAADAARKHRGRIALFQECTSLLWAQGKEEATIQVEHLFNKLAYEYDLDILCGYSIAYFNGEEDIHLIQRICAAHSAVDSK